MSSQAAPLPSAFFDESKDKVVGDGRKVNNAVRHFIRDDYIRKKVRRFFFRRKREDAMSNCVQYTIDKKKKHPLIKKNESSNADDRT